MGTDDRALLDSSCDAERHAAPSCRASSFCWTWSFSSFLGLVWFFFFRFLCSVKWLQSFVLVDSISELHVFYAAVQEL